MKLIRNKMKTIPSFALLSLLIASISLFSVGCQSPLDADGPRTATPLTPAIKIDPSSMTVVFNTASNSYSMDPASTFKIDSSVTPMRIWMDFKMSVDVDPDTMPVIRNFSCKLDSFAIDGLYKNLISGEVKMDLYLNKFPLETVASATTTNLAAAIVAEHPHVEGQPRRITMTLFMLANDGPFFAGVPTERVIGTIDFVL